MDNVKVGASILSIITESLYDNPIVVFREYVQNSVDSIFQTDNPKNREIRIWVDGDNLYFLDNGIGIKPTSFYDEMVKIGASTKEKQKNLGYKGIGRLSGVPYCEELTFVNISNYNNDYNQKYTIRGILMNKATGEPLLINGAKVEGAVEIEPTESCGSAEVFFHFDATGLQDTVVVVFESLFEFTTDTDDGDPIITHEDINDEDQAVVIYLTTPNTGHFTINSGGVQGTKLMIAPAAVALTLGGYVAYRIHARKRFLGRM